MVFPTIADPAEHATMKAAGLGAFADVWEMRQESDIILDDGAEKNHFDDDAAADAGGDDSHACKVVRYNPYSLDAPVTDLFVCVCMECSGSGNNSKHADEYAAADDDDVAMGEEEEAAVEVSPFMPPPPPRPDTFDVLSACGAEDADAVIYQLMMRWFTRVAAVQRYFLAAGDEPCPEPAPEHYDFKEWCEMVNAWWFANFEHRQKKQQPAPQRHQSFW